MGRGLRQRAEAGEQRQEQAGKRRLTDRAEAQAGDGDTDLGGRQVSGDVPQGPPRHAGLNPALLGQLLDARGTHLDHGKFSRHEEAVQQHQQQCEDDA